MLQPVRAWTFGLRAWHFLCPGCTHWPHDRVHCALILGRDARQVLSLFVVMCTVRDTWVWPDSELAEAMEVLPDTISFWVLDYGSSLEIFTCPVPVLSLKLKLGALKP